MVKMIVDEYKDFTIDEIEVAFTKAYAGKLIGNDNKPLDVQTYQNYSVIYLCNVLNAYRIYRQSETKKEIDQGKIQELHESKILQPDGEAAWNRIKSWFDQKGVLPKIDDYDAAYYYAIKEKIIVLNGEQKSEIKERARAEEIRWDKEMFDGNNVKNILKEENLQRICRKQAVIDHFIKTKK